MFQKDLAFKMVNVFAVPVFFIVFREVTETSIVVSVLLAFLKQQLGRDVDKKVYRKLQKQVSLPIFPQYSQLTLPRSGMAPSSVS